MQEICCPMLMPVLRCRWFALGVLAAGLAASPLGGQAPELGAFSGRVLDEEGQPLAGATIVIRGIDIEQRRETQTDEEGRFYYGGFRPGRYYIIILREGRILWSVPVTLEPSHPRLHITVDLKKLREAAEEAQRLDPELARQQQALRQRLEHEQRLQRHFNRGTRLLREGKPEEAIEEFQAALEMEPDRHVTFALLGSAYAEADRQPEAIAAYRRAIELEPNEAAHHNNLATLLVRKGELDEALSHFATAAQLDPERAATYLYNSGAALLNAGHPEEALPRLRQAVRSDPKLAVAHYFLGLALLRTSRRTGEQGGGRIDPQPGTIKAFQQYLRLAPDGEYAESARNHLRQLGVAPPEMLLPDVSPPEGTH